MRRQMKRREDYRKLIYILSKKGEVHGVDLAEKLNVKRPTVLIYLKCLVENGDITMDKHRCVYLTEQGCAIAETTLSKRGVLFALLQDLGVPEAIAAENACAIEHNISPEPYSTLKQLLHERRVSL